MSKQDGGPAFPYQVGTQSGMTLREYAAIKLKVPDSGTDWLDDMIRESLRNDFASKAMQGMAANQLLMATDGRFSVHNFKASYKMADEMLAAREAK